jgi:hypothetical protein
MAKTPDDEYSEKEAQARFEAALKGGMNTPHKPHSEMKLCKKRPHKSGKIPLPKPQQRPKDK